MPTLISLEKTLCPICQGVDYIYLFSAKDTINNLDGYFNIVKCNKCNLIRTEPRPTPDSMSYYYPSNYGPYSSTKIENKVEEKKSIIKKLKNLFKSNSQKIPTVSQGNLLEIGSASGSYLKKMKKEGWNVHGIEFSSVAGNSAIAEGLDVTIGSLENIKLPDTTYDLIVGWMVLEHLHNPVNCLLKLLDVSNTNTWLVISVPNADCWGFKYFKKNWYSLHVPNHLYHYDRETIKKILNMGGWETYQILGQHSFSDFFVSLGNLLHEKKFIKTGNFIKNLFLNHYQILYILYPIAWIINKKGKPSRITVWAKKIT